MRIVKDVERLIISTSLLRSRTPRGGGNDRDRGGSDRGSNIGLSVREGIEGVRCRGRRVVIVERRPYLSKD